MPYTTNNYTGSPDILMGVHGMRSPIHRTIDLASIAPSPNGKKFIPAGTFFADLTGGYCRPLRRTKVTADTPAGATIIPIISPQFFAAGDALLTIVPTGQVTLSSSTTGWAVADTITVTIAGQAVIYTVIAGDIGGSLVATNGLIAAKVAALINAQSFRLVTASASLAIVNLTSTTGEAHTLTATDTGANGAVTASGATLIARQTVGTIASINVALGTITLSAGSAVALLAGQAIGINTRPIGMIVQSLSLGDLDGIDAPEQGLYTSVSVRLDLLPYYDPTIKTDLPEIQAV